MKNRTVLLIVMLTLVLGGVVILNQSRTKMFAPENISEIAMPKKEALENYQKFDDPEIASHVAKKMEGKEKLLAGLLNETLKELEVFLAEIRTAFVEGRVTIKYNKYAASNIGRLETPSEKIRVDMIEEDGRFRQCEKISYSNGNVQSQQKVVFWDDNRTLKRYQGPVGQVYFTQDGNLEGFIVAIDGIKHNISWESDGRISLYRTGNNPENEQ